MFELKKWKLDTHGPSVKAVGKCYGNPRFPKGYYIRTSSVITADISNEPEQIILTTYSGSHYSLSFGEIDEEAYKSTGECAKVLGLELDMERCLCLRQQEVKRTIERLEGVLEPREMYAGIDESLKIYEAYYRPEQGEITKVAAVCHTGMFTDSVIVGGCTRRPYPCEWRYMIDGRRICCYVWEGQLDAVRIFNEGRDFHMEDGKRDILCKGNEITFVKRQGGQ